jgi:hypothetical protein
MRFGLGLAAAVLLVAGVARAQPPATPVRLSLDYDGDLIVKVLDIHLEASATPATYNASTYVRSYGILAALKRFDIKASASGRIEDGAPQPGVFLYDNHDGERDRKVQVAWRADDVTARSSPPYGNLGQPPASLPQKLASADPLTQVTRLILASSSAQVCNVAPLFFDGKQLYSLEFGPGRPVEPDPRQRALGVTTAIRCIVTYHEVAGFKHKRPGRRDDALRSQINVTFGQFGPNGPWAIAKLSAATMLGDAVIALTRVQIAHDATAVSSD